MSGVKVLRSAVSVMLMAAAAAFCDYAAWTKSGVVTIGTTPEWANFTGSVANFPILVKLDSSTFTFSEAKAAGADIRFSTSDGVTALPYEIETWDAAKGTASIWVKIPAIAGNATQTIKMYWGNAAATTESNGAAVFQPSAGYIGVWHLSDAATSTTNKDATGNGNDGSKLTDSTKAVSAADIGVVSSPLGSGQSYNLTKRFAQTEVPAGKVDLKNKSLTVSAWIKRNATNGTGDYFIAQGTQDPNTGLRLGFDYLNRFTFCFGGGLSDTQDPFTQPTLSLDWHYWVGTFDLTTKKMSVYMDGVLDTSTTVPSAFTGSGALDMGWAYGPSGEYYHPSGSLDEVRISGNVASPDWIKLSYLNQTAGQKLVSYPVAAGCTENFAVNSATVAVNEGVPTVLQGTAKCAQSFAWVKVEGGTEVPVVSNGTRLDLTARVAGTSTLTYRFKALFAGVWKSKDVAVTVTEKIPEPNFTLTVPAVFDISDGSVPLTVTPAISNLAAIKASSSPNLNYVWTVTGAPNFVSKSKPDGDTLSVYFTGEGKTDIQLCLDNGGAPICKTATTNASATGIISGGKMLNQKALNLKGSSLVWNQNASIQIWNLSGKVLFSASGSKGDNMNLTSAQMKLFRGNDHIVKISPLGNAGNQSHQNVKAGGM